MTSSLLAPALHVEPEPTAEQEAADDDATSTAARNGRGAAGPRTVMDQIVDVICAAYVPDENDSNDKPNPATVAIEQMVVKVRHGAPSLGLGHATVADTGFLDRHPNSWHPGAAAGGHVGER